jgi:hypothetical protein
LKYEIENIRKEKVKRTQELAEPEETTKRRIVKAALRNTGDSR